MLFCTFRKQTTLVLACIAFCWTAHSDLPLAHAQKKGGGGGGALYSLVDLKGFPIVYAGRSNYLQSLARSLNDPDSTGRVQVVGNSFVQGREGDRAPYRVTPTLWNVNANGSFAIVDLGLLDAEQEATATDVNEWGAITITTNQSTDLQDGHPVLPAWVLPGPGQARIQLAMRARQAKAVAINFFGEVAGRDHADTIVGVFWQMSAPSVEVPLGGFHPSDIDDEGVMAGSADGAPAIAWFDETDALQVEPLTGWNGNATAISPNGDYVAGWMDMGTGGGAFVHDRISGETTFLGTLGGAGSEALGVNNSGHVVGWADTGNSRNPQAAFLWKDGRLHNLNSLTETGSGRRLLEAAAINNAGHIVGFMETTSKGDTEERAYVVIPK